MLEFEVKSKVQPVAHRARDLAVGGRCEERADKPLQRGVRSPAAGHERRPGRAGQPPPQRPLEDDGHAGGGHRERRAEEPENRLHAEAADARRRQRGGAEHRPPQEGRGRRGGRNLHRLAVRNLRNGPVPAWTFQRDGVYGMREIIAIFLARRGKKIEGNIANVRIYFRIFAL